MKSLKYIFLKVKKLWKKFLKSEKKVWKEVSKEV